MKTNVFIDTDCGYDDVIAITLLLESRKVNAAGITTVNGVATAYGGARTLSRIVTWLHCPIAIASGATRALVEKDAQFPARDRLRARRLTLLQNLPLPKATTNRVTRNASLFLRQSFKQNSNTVLICLGPLTNIAKAIRCYGNDFTQTVRRIVLMGGALGSGNVAPNRYAEYNMWLDPEAADIVFSSGIPITMVPLEATRFVPVNDPRWLNMICKKTSVSSSNAGRLLKEIIRNNDRDFDAFYDPVAVAVFLDPALITQYVDASIRVTLRGPRRGRTTVIRKNGNTRMVIAVDAKRFYQKLLAVTSYP